MSFAIAMNSQSPRAFLRRPWSLARSFYIAAGIGAALPVLKVSLYRCFDWAIVPFVFFPLVAILIGVLHWQVGRDQFRTDWRAMPATVAAGLLWAGAAAGSGWCCCTHICMGGHMEHPPYELWHYAADTAWTTHLGLAVICMFAVRSSLCLSFGMLSSFIISYRFIFQSLGGMYMWLPL